MKKLIALLLALICVLGLVGCSNIQNDNPPTTGEEKWDLIPMVMVDGVLYLDTGHNNTDIRKCGTPDGEITSEVDGSEKPTANDQSNFGTGYGYQYGATEGTIEIYMNDKWCIFATEEVRQQIQFPNKESETGSNDTVLKEPPVLTVICGKESVEALRGTTSWMYQNEDGTGSGIESDSMHPLQAKEYMTPLDLIPTPISSIDPLTANLQWDTTPDKVVVRCWGEECWGRYDAESEDILVDVMGIDFNSQLVTNYVIQLKDGNYIYEVVAEWNSSETWGGTAYYSFYTVKPDMELHPIEEADDLCGYPLAPTE